MTIQRITTLLVILGAALFGTSGSVHAYPVGGVTVEITGTPSPGGTITVTVRNCPAGTPVVIGLDGRLPVTVICQGDVVPGLGVATTQLTLPNNSGRVDGTVVLVTGQTIPFSVVIPATAGTVPRTGSSGLGEKSAMAVGLMALGGGLLAVARTRRRTLVPA